MCLQHSMTIFTRNTNTVPEKFSHSFLLHLLSSGKKEWDAMILEESRILLRLFQGISCPELIELSLQLHAQ